MYWKRPTAAELEGTGYRPTDFQEPTVEVWDENWDVLALYNTYHSQWRVGMAGPVGLDLNVFHHALDRKGVTGAEYDQFIDDLNVIESAVLDKLSSQ